MLAFASGNNAEMIMVFYASLKVKIKSKSAGFI